MYRGNAEQENIKMTKKKIWTKTSAMLALISCIALIAALVGTTLAYFADSAPRLTTK